MTKDIKKKKMKLLTVDELHTRIICDGLNLTRNAFIGFVYRFCIVLKSEFSPNIKIVKWIEIAMINIYKSIQTESWNHVYAWMVYYGIDSEYSNGNIGASMYWMGW